MIVNIFIIDTLIELIIMFYSLSFGHLFVPCVNLFLLIEAFLVNFLCVLPGFFIMHQVAIQTSSICAHQVLVLLGVVLVHF